MRRQTSRPCTWTLVACLVTCLVSLATCHSADKILPPALHNCYATYQPSTKEGDVEGEEIHSHCIQHFLWKHDAVPWHEFNVTEKDFDVMNSYIRSFLKRTMHLKANGTKNNRYRVRREYRVIPDKERDAYHKAINALKMTGEYDIFAKLHAGIVFKEAHQGPNFFGWHRIYLVLFEEALRRIDPEVVLPYWDSTLDANMTYPQHSITWSDKFLGDGYGFVKSGPFANWKTPTGPLVRLLGSDGNLIPLSGVRKILSKCRTSEITEPTAKEGANLEQYHNDVHNWVGGIMSNLDTAAHDPTFFVHHAFLDYIWEKFRIRQISECNVAPYYDYPPTKGMQNSSKPMAGLTGFHNMDGYGAYWCLLWYNYEETPTCTVWKPDCGSPYLRCDIKNRLCVPLVRTVTLRSGKNIPVSEVLVNPFERITAMREMLSVTGG